MLNIAKTVSITSKKLYVKLYKQNEHVNEDQLLFLLTFFFFFFSSLSTLSSSHRQQHSFLHILITIITIIISSTSLIIIIINRNRQFETKTLFTICFWVDGSNFEFLRMLKG
ncbi:hypothetical protein QVD17_29827 [Tagetes erecta]|uniref:Transmembrane protein n=1 Tax=Tagetes erecta TaxID=13708 RepID=A0AAD8K4F9_TARER|nr:hypothetical protein QVD17_29827 [Tagetes erecta]